MKGEAKGELLQAYLGLYWGANMLLSEGSSWALSEGKPLIEKRLPSNSIGLSDRRTRSVASESGRRRDWSRSRVPDR